jgi:hypothetical protein
MLTWLMCCRDSSPPFWSESWALLSEGFAESSQGNEYFIGILVNEMQEVANGFDRL